MSVTQTVDIPADECPMCAAHRDPITGEERFNAETAAAIREGRAMMRGEIPAKWYDSLDEMWQDLVKEDVPAPALICCNAPVKKMQSAVSSSPIL